jgi:hypothetical protein
MFWKKTAPVPPEAKPTKEKAKPQKSEKKEKKLSPKDIVAGRIEQLGPGQSISYQLSEFYGGDLAIVELNPDYPRKGQKYILSTQKMVDGKPMEKISCFWESNKPQDLAGWIVDRYDKLFS